MPRKTPDLSGQKFTRLTAISICGKDKIGRKLWLCKCDCGNTTVASSDNLKRNHTRSCGCLVKEIVKTISVTHGKRHTSTYKVWAGIKQRCTNQNEPAYKNYGGRGISMCDEWKNSFAAFLQDMGERPAGMSLDRIDNNNGYNKHNCRWATRTTQARNTRSNSKYTHNGITLCLSEWAERLDINYKKLHGRIKTLGWSFEQAIVDC